MANKERGVKKGASSCLEIFSVKWDKAKLTPLNTQLGTQQVVVRGLTKQQSLRGADDGS